MRRIPLNRVRRFSGIFKVKLKSENMFETLVLQEKQLKNQ